MAQQIWVWAPCGTDLKNGDMIILETGLDSMNECFCNSVKITPGCREYVVTPVPEMQ